MKINFAPRFLTAVLVLLPATLWAWGERAHHVTGYTAAATTALHLTDEEKVKVGKFFSDRTIQFGHLNNMPDISWKDPRRPLVVRVNAPTHYFDTEFLYGMPGTTYSKEYLDKIRSTEKDYRKYHDTYQGKPNPLPGATYKNIDVFFDVGTSPWRIQELYDLLVEAFKCAGGKPAKKSYFGAKEFKDPFVRSNVPVSPVYSCKKKSSRTENIYAAIAIAGIMGHFIADLAQPLHCSADFDSWTTGQGGIHAYFETYFVQGLGGEFALDVAKKAAVRADIDKIWAPVASDPRSKTFATEVALNLVSESIKLLPTLREIDREYALVKPSSILPWGSPLGTQYGERKSPLDKDLTKKLKPLVVDRISTAAVIISRLWVEAWRQAGSPDLTEITMINTPYTLDVPYLWPSYPAKGFEKKR